mmetsp:Transcript_81532/g.239416  ORF Transcript_81532/g.239416 Transcript_81532/m.239416 type:complete len:240 (-) Transcript_81532:201-920(-)
MPQTVTDETPVMCVGTCSPVMRPFTPQVVTTMGIFATSPLAIVATRSPNSTHTWVAMQSDRFWPKMIAWDGALSIASTVGSGWTILGMPQYFLDATAGSKASFGTRLSVTGQAAGPAAGGGPLPAGICMGFLGACLRYSAVMLRASSISCFRFISFSSSFVERKMASASRAYFKPSSRSALAKQPLASNWSVLAVPKTSPAASKSARASLPCRRPSGLPESMESTALARSCLAWASPRT